jgi:4-aminobutyrate aminotransferase
MSSAALLVLVGSSPHDEACLDDLLSSIVSYEPRLVACVLVDDGAEPRDLTARLGAGAALPIAVVRHPRCSHPAPKNGALAVGVLSGLAWLSQRTDLDFVLKIDLDALAIAPFAERIAEFLRTHPCAGLVGCRGSTCNRAHERFLRCLTQRSPFAMALEMLERTDAARPSDVQRLAVQHPIGEVDVTPAQHAALRELRPWMTRAVAHGHVVADYCQGGSYAVSGTLLRRMTAEGVFDRIMPWLRLPFFGEDEAMAMFCYALGFRLYDFSAPGEPFGISWHGLPCSPSELVARHALIHSLKQSDPHVEAAHRDFFAALRPAASSPWPERITIRRALMRVPQITVTEPGPKAAALIDRDRRVISPSYTRGYPLVMARGRGAEVEDTDGNVFLDCTAGIAVTSTGHSHPDVVQAIVDQAQKFLHMSGTDFYYEPQITLAEELAAIVPIRGPVKTFFGNSGTEANEAAIKLARFHSRRPYLIAFLGSFHGRSLGSLSLTASRAVQRRGLGPTAPGVFHTPYADCYRCPLALRAETCQAECLDYLEDRILVQLVSPDDVAAIVVEPIQGEGGYLVPPATFHQRLASIAEKYGMLLIADEVQTGMGRTGRMFASEHFGIQPDIVSMAKGLASGMPLGATAARADVMDWAPGSHASTFGGNPVSCAAAQATIRLLRNTLTANAAAVGAYLLEGLQELQQRHPLVGDVRGKGLMIGIELVRNRTTKERATTERDAIVDHMFERGVLVLGAGRNTIRLCPPLVLTRDQADVCLYALDDAIGSVERGRH